MVGQVRRHFARCPLLKSNTGVLRRRVDARWRIHPKDLSDLPVIQRKIVENALPCLKPGGRLVYSTCSIEPEENALLVRKISEDHPEKTNRSRRGK
ncbi:MAG: hypothetical protein EAZ81_10350 [Verrucomicrobia bacterium]|nr:MAG: hypothetical protein EAZ81_10350 [Verrucomicrobiota bacterium]